MGKWVDEWVGEWVDEWVDKWVDEWVDKWVGECVVEWVDELMDEWVDELVDEWVLVGNDEWPKRRIAICLARISMKQNDFVWRLLLTRVVQIPQIAFIQHVTCGIFDLFDHLQINTNITIHSYLSYC